MSSSLLLAWRYVSFHRGRSLILTTCVTLSFLLPFSVTGLVGRYSESLVSRGRATPLVAGALGSRYDLVLSSLYFTGRLPRSLSMAEANELSATGFARVVPLVLGLGARGFPLVGTTPDYFVERGLAPRTGELPLVLGEAVLGAGVADELGLGPGDTLLTDDGSLYDLSLRAPLQLEITGVLAESGTSDDRGIFVDVKTAWIGLGIGHGHAEPTAAEAQLAEENGATESVTLGAATYEFTEFTPENLASFHFHGDASGYPLTALLLFPLDVRSATKLKARYRLSDKLQLLTPTEVVDELLGLVFKAKLFFDANSALVSVSTFLFLALVLLLSVRVRSREIATLTKIGCARRTIAAVFGLELGLLVAGGLALSYALSLGLAQVLRQLLGA